jgi:hypothetical protein
MEANKTLNYAIWITVIGGGLYLLYKKFGKGEIRLFETTKTTSLEEIQKIYPNWGLKTSSSSKNPYYSKNFWTLNEDGTKFKEMWFIFYHNGTWKIYTRANPEVFVAGGTYTKPTNLEVTDGFNKGNTFNTNSLSKSVAKILNQKVSDLPNN